MHHIIITLGVLNFEALISSLLTSIGVADATILIPLVKVYNCKKKTVKNSQLQRIYISCKDVYEYVQRTYLSRKLALSRYKIAINR